MDLIDSVKNFYSNNKKICEVINSIFNIINPSNYSKTKPIKQSEVNLLGEEFGRDSIRNTNTNSYGKMSLFVKFYFWKIILGRIKY